MSILRKYGVATFVSFPMIKAGAQDFAVAADWTPATGDTKISKNEGNVGNTEGNPALLGGTGAALWTLSLTTTEMEAARILIQIVDSATKTVEDQAIVIETYGHASAEHAFDLDTALVTLAAVTHTGAVIPTVTTLTNAPSDSSGVTTLLSRLSAARAGYLDNLSAGAVALEVSITTITNRIGAFTGSGVNTILGFLKAIANKAASLPSDIGGTFAVATDSLEGIRDALSSGTASIVSPVASDGDITIVRGDAYSGSDITIPLTTNPSLVGATSVTFYADGVNTGTLTVNTTTANAGILYLALTVLQSAALTKEEYDYHAVCTLSGGSVRTLAIGKLRVRAGATA